MAQEDDPQADLKATGAVAALPVLYSFRRCPYAMRARMAIASSGQRCELREVVLRDKPPELIAASPKGTVPVLVDVDGAVIEQSLDIMLWALRKNDPEGWLLPQGATQAEMLALIAECDDGFKRDLDKYKYPERHPDIDVDADAHRARGGVFLAQLEGRLKATPCLHGDAPGLADIALMPFVRQFAQVDAAWFAAQPWPRLQSWLAARVESNVFVRVMAKYAPWRGGDAGVPFP